MTGNAYIGNVPVALLDACEQARCPCKHEALDHAWHGCEECGCKRSAIHALLASGTVTVSPAGQPGSHVLDTAVRPAACSCGAAKYAGSPTFVRERHIVHLEDVVARYSSASPYVVLAEEQLDEAERDDPDCTSPPASTDGDRP